MEISNVSILSTQSLFLLAAPCANTASELLRPELPTCDIGDDSRKIPDPEWPFSSLFLPGAILSPV